MPPSIIQSRSNWVLGFAPLLAVSVALAPVTGCEPATPHGGTSAGAAPDAGTGANKGTLPDAAAGTPRPITALESDANTERSMPASGMGGATGCAPIGVLAGSDGGAAATAPPDASGGDVVRDVGPSSPAVDAGRVDGAGSGASEGGIASGGAMGITDGGRGGGGASAGGGTSGGGGTGDEVSSAPAPGLRDLAIVELLINPAGTDTGREWIEIVNRTTHTLDLAGLNISDAANDAAVNFGTDTATALLPAGGSAILIQSADPTKNGGVTIGGATRGGSFGTLVSLNNDADTISICSGPCATGVVIDRVSWDATLGTGYDGHALMIDSSGRRCPAILPFGDAGSFGSPGVASSPCP